MASFQGSPPEAVPEERIAVRNNSADSQFWEIIKHAQRLPSEYSPITDAVESHQGELLVRAKDHCVYTIAIVVSDHEETEGRM